MRFGEITPHFAADVVPDDQNTLSCSHEFNTFTLKAPLMQGIRMKKDYFQVPLPCIYPINSEKIIATPALGSDISDPVVSQMSASKLCYYISMACANFRNYRQSNFTYGTSQTKATNQDALQRFLTHSFAMLNLVESLLSAGSLANTLGIRLPYFVAKKNSLDTTYTLSVNDICRDFIDQVVQSGIKAFSITRSVGGASVYNTVIVNPADVVDDDLAGRITLRQFLELVRDEGFIEVTDIYDFDSHEIIEAGTSDNCGTWVTGIIDYLGPLIGGINFVGSEDVNSIHINFERLVAYQMVCAHFYTNDHVDFVYSADLWRQNMKSLAMAAYDPNFNPSLVPWPTFTYNGVSTDYDVVSGEIFEHLFYNWEIGCSRSSMFTDANKAQVAALYGWFANIFGFRHSLRFMDYFTGSKTRPLAVGDVDIPVQSGSPDFVNVIDVTQKIQVQRFLNAVNRTGRKLSDYLMGLFGTDMGYDYHNPMYLGSTTDLVTGKDTQNTGAAQLTENLPVTSRLMDNSSRYAFDVNSDVYGIIIGLTSFDIHRAYAMALDRTVLHVTRYDRFNPFLEYVGDQPVLLAELDASNLNKNSYFGYQTRYMEYKQRVPRAIGGFVNNLPGLCFIADHVNATNGQAPTLSSINEEYIRSHNSELDEFYVSLTGLTLEDYFHFIVKTDNILKSNRPMAANPEIL